MLRAPASSPLFLTYITICAIFVCQDDFEHAYLCAAFSSLVILMLHYVACVYVRKVVSRRQELGKFFIEIMSNLNLFVAGSIHQGSERFYSEFHAEDNVLS